MFGYITPVLSVLEDDRKARYRAVYCGLCRSLRKRSGQLGRLTLSNDMTFLALLLSSLYEPDSSTSPSRCAVHPLHAHPYEQSHMIDYAADMNLLLAYYKSRDQIIDEGAGTGKLSEKSLRPAFERIAREYPAQAEAVRGALEELWRLEKEPAPEADALCNLSGDMLGAVFVPDPQDFWAPVLRRLGEGLGRFVYWMDAFEDFDADQKKGRFNPLKPYRSRGDYYEFCQSTLELFMAEASEAFELLPLEKDLDLLRNVMYSGVWQRWIQLEKRRQKKDSSGKEEKPDAES